MSGMVTFERTFQKEKGGGRSPQAAGKLKQREQEALQEFLLRLSCGVVDPAGCALKMLESTPGRLRSQSNVSLPSRSDQ